MFEAVNRPKPIQYPNLSALAALNPNSKAFEIIKADDPALTCGQRTIVKSAFLRHLIAFFARLAFAIPYIILKAHEFVVGSYKVKGAQLPAKVEKFIREKNAAKAKKGSIIRPRATRQLDLPKVLKKKEKRTTAGSQTKTTHIKYPLILSNVVTSGLPNAVGGQFRNTCWVNSVLQVIANTCLLEILEKAIKNHKPRAPTKKGRQDESALVQIVEYALNTARLMLNPSKDLHESLDEARLQFYNAYLEFRAGQVTHGSQDDANQLLRNMLSILQDPSTTGVEQEIYYTKDGDFHTQRERTLEKQCTICFRQNYQSVSVGLGHILISPDVSLRDLSGYEFSEKAILTWHLEKLTDTDTAELLKEVKDIPQFEFKENPGERTEYKQPINRTIVEHLNQKLLAPAPKTYTELEKAFIEDQAANGNILKRNTQTTIPLSSRVLIVTTDQTSRTMTDGLEMHLDVLGNEYELVGTIHHSGELSGGHYTAYTRKKDGGWLHRSDEDKEKPCHKPSQTFSTLIYQKVKVALPEYMR